MMDGRRPRRAVLIAGAALAVLVVLALAVGGALARAGRQARLVRADPDALAGDARMARYAERLARPAYASHCAACHGDRMQGDRRIGAPALADKVWLYEDGDVASIERTLLYGIRSGLGKSRNIAEMPALGRSQQLTRAETLDVVRYVRYLSGADHPDAETLKRGSAIFQGKGVCYDCHSSDARGNPDYGAPDLTDREWLYGGDAANVFTSVYDGRHGICPGFIRGPRAARASFDAAAGVTPPPDTPLSPAQIRALALYIHAVSHPAPKAPAS